MKIYGIANCSTVKKALGWLKEHNIAYEFHDFKKSGISAGKLKEWDSKAGYQKFMNKQGLTYKGLAPAVKAGITGSQSALQVLQQKTSIIKRPVIEDGGFLFFGFDEAVYNQHFLTKQ